MTDVLPCSCIVVHNINDFNSFHNKCDDKNTRIQHHRSFVSTDLVKLEKLKGLYNWKKKCFLDEYFDDKEYTLSKNNMWLRRRDIFNWCLKIASISEDKNIHFKEIHDKKSIIKALSDIGCKLVCVDEIDKNVLSQHIRLRCDKILNYCPVRIASIPTSRWTIDDELSDSSFYFDSCAIKENIFYNTATLSMKGTVKSQLLHKLEDFKDILYHPARSKVIQSLFINDENLYKLLKSKDIILLDYGDSIINTCLFPSPTVSPDEMGKVAIFAVENHIDLANAAYIYHNSNEDRYDDKDTYTLTEKDKISLMNAIKGASQYSSSTHK